MNPFSSFAAVVVIAGCGALTASGSVAASAPAAAKFYPFVGMWHGHGELTQTGQPPITLSLRASCQKASSGWAVRCAMSGKNKQMTVSESDLMGVDPVTGQAHWYAVTNQGDTHDHLVTWTDAHTMLAHHDWVQDGKHMHEAITFKFSGKRSMTFRSVVSADGKEAEAFSGSLRR